MTIELNGVAPDGDHPPDEILYHPDGGEYVELLRQGHRRGIDDWRLVRGPKGYSKPVGDDFAAAFAEFAAEVQDAKADKTEVKA